MKAVLVTGGAGYIGSHTAKALAAAGFLPVTYDNLHAGHQWAVQWGPFVKADLKETKSLFAVFAKYQPVAVLHFAASIEVGESVKDPLKYYDNNVGSTLALLKAMREFQVQTIVFSSTCATYGSPKKIPIDESHPQSPINPYGRSKLAVESILRDMHAAYGLKYAALRYFNAAGADREGKIGEAHPTETHLIPLAIGAALQTEPPLKLFGNDYPTLDGTAVRDYIHVEDLAQAHCLALQELLSNRSSFLELNLGTGRGYSVQEVVRTVEEVTGRKVPYSYAPRRAGDPPELVANATKAREQLGWTPRYSDLETIVKTAFDWHAAALHSTLTS